MMIDLPPPTHVDTPHRGSVALPDGGRPSALDSVACARALEARDPRFDGVFFVAIRTTGIYCRPICPSRLSKPERRRYFASAAAAERAGFRPCLRCRPELAPGRAIVDAVPRVAHAAALRISAGALNDRSVGELADELGVGERHLRRAMERELGVSPGELAQTHRLLLAKGLLTDTSLPVTRIAFASGFQSLRRFNTVFRERYGMAPTALRKLRVRPAPRAHGDLAENVVRLRLAYRPPLAWAPLLRALGADAVAGIDTVDDLRYARTVVLGQFRGTVFVEHAGERRSPEGAPSPAAHVTAGISVSLLPVLMPLLARLRQVLDLDAEPEVIDTHLARGGLGTLVARHPGLRVPGSFGAFEGAMRELLRREPGTTDLRSRVVSALGESIETDSTTLDRLWPTPEAVLAAGLGGLGGLGVPLKEGCAVVALARALSSGSLCLEPGAGVQRATEALARLPGIDERTAARIAMRTLHWPDAFPDPVEPELAAMWRPWRSYAAAHLSLSDPSVDRQLLPVDR